MALVGFIYVASVRTVPPARQLAEPGRASKHKLAFLFCPTTHAAKAIIMHLAYFSVHRIGNEEEIAPPRRVLILKTNYVANIASGSKKKKRQFACSVFLTRGALCGKPRGGHQFVWILFSVNERGAGALDMYPTLLESAYKPKVKVTL